MSQPERLLSASSTTTAPSAEPSPSQLRKDTWSPVVVFPSVELPGEPAEGMLSLDDVFQALSARDPDFEAGLPEATKLAGEALYPEEISVRKLRTNMGLSQTQLAEKLGTKQPQIAKIESGRHNTLISTIESLAEVFDIPGEEMYKIISAGRKKL